MHHRDIPGRCRGSTPSGEAQGAERASTVVTKKTWVILVVAFIISSCVSCTLVGLQIRAGGHGIAAGHSVSTRTPDETATEYAARAYGEGIGRQLGECLIFGSVAITGILFVGLVLGGLVELTKRL